MAETIENNVRKLIIDEQPINPKYYEKMSELLDALIEQRRKEALDYQEYLREDRRADEEGDEPGGGPGGYPAALNTPGKRALVRQPRQGRGAGAWRWMRPSRASRQDDWREQPDEDQEGEERHQDVLAADARRKQPQGVQDR